jgi:hypothetical protein
MLGSSFLFVVLFAVLPVMLLFFVLKATATAPTVECTVVETVERSDWHSGETKQSKSWYTLTPT